MKKLLTTLSILLIATAGYAQGEVYTETELKVQLPFGEADSTESSKTYTVERVIDGGTLKLTNGERVRLIGIDTPESKPNDKAKRDSKRTGQDLETITKMGQEATKFVKRWAWEGIQVRMEYDVDQKDKYGRTLAYVYLDTRTGMWNAPPRDEVLHLIPIASTYHIFLNATIIKAGYATPMTIPPNVKYADLFKKLYEEAREQKRGLWKKKLEDSFSVQISDERVAVITPNWEKIKNDNGIPNENFKTYVIRSIEKAIGKNFEIDIIQVEFHRFYMRMMDGEHRSIGYKIGDYADVKIIESKKE